MLKQVLKFSPQVLHTLSLRILLYIFRKRYLHLKDRLIPLEGKIFLMIARDIRKRYYIGVENGVLRLYYRYKTSPHVVIEGDLADLIGLLLKTRDADSLFFSRRLKIEGDIEASVYFKNLLESI